MTVTVPLGEAAPPAPVVELVGVVKQYAGDPPVVALAGVDPRIGLGELVAIVGPCSGPPFWFVPRYGDAWHCLVTATTRDALATTLDTRGD